jgi:serine/threonine protein phosphatase PrpC
MSDATMIDRSTSGGQTLLVTGPEWTEPLEYAMAEGDLVMYSARAPDKLSANQDAAAAIPVGANGGVLIVADGLGGERAGHDASALAVQAVAEALRKPDVTEARLRTAILDGIEDANRMILEMGIGAATTIAVAEIHDGHVRPYHVGDSMILVVGARGKVKLQTVSHSPVGMAVESGWLDEVDAMHHDERHIVSNVLGSTAMRIEIGPSLKLAPRDTVLLASDGLCDNLCIPEIIGFIRKGRLHASTGDLVRAAHERMIDLQPGAPHKPDDLTVITYRRRPSAEETSIEQAERPLEPLQPPNPCTQPPSGSGETGPSGS